MSYILNTPEDVKAMLARIGCASIEDLFSPVPAHLRLQRPLNIPPALGELELTREMETMAARNQAAGQLTCFLGGGAYDHFVPTVVDVIAGRSEYYTSYTPYQAEASQGTLQAIYEYQTLICQLTGMDVANASLYEGASSVAEAALMAMNITGRTGEILVAASVHPDSQQTLTTYLANLPCSVRILSTPEGFLNPQQLAREVNDRTIAVVAQSPNFFGHLEPMAEIGAVARKVGALFIASFDPISLGLLKRPADYGADIAVAEGQSLGIPLGFGGPYLGILACRQEYVRKIPGRLVGETVDRNGKRCWVLTLQAREQHIARNRATSNICTNQGLLALRAAVYLAAVGPQGLRETAERCLRNAHYAARTLTAIPGVSLKYQSPYFKEFTIQVPGDAGELLARLRKEGYLAGLPLGRWYPELSNCMSVAVTEKRTQDEMDGLASTLRRLLS